MGEREKSNRLSPDERIAGLESKLQVTFTDKSLGLAAVTHKSYANEHRDENGSDNERLEFLGDAVIDLAVSHRLMERFPKAEEGELSKLRALIVNEEGLAKVARRLGLGELLQLGRGEELTGGREKSSVLADALEAVIGAVYLDGGLSKVMLLVDTQFGEVLEGVADGRSGFDYKTRLQELIQTKHKISPRYKVVAESGPDHAKVFEVELTIASEPHARATGRNKKEAEQSAAKVALERLQSEEPKP
ncbi:MAG: ribonuclease III [Myxococcaceae bacterium]